MNFFCLVLAHSSSQRFEKKNLGSLWYLGYVFLKTCEEARKIPKIADRSRRALEAPSFSKFDDIKVSQDIYSAMVEVTAKLARTIISTFA